jgi:hypothetical protein
VFWKKNLLRFVLCFHSSSYVGISSFFNRQPQQQQPQQQNNQQNNRPSSPPPRQRQEQQAHNQQQQFARAPSGIRSNQNPIDQFFTIASQPKNLILATAFLFSFIWLWKVYDNLHGNVVFDGKGTVLLYLLTFFIVNIELYHFNRQFNRWANTTFFGVASNRID